MDKRSIFALILIAVVIVGGQLLMPRTTPSPETLADSTQRRPASHAAESAAVSTPRAPAVAPRAPNAAVIRAETVSVVGANRVIQFATNGAGPLSVSLPEYPDLKRRDGALRIVANRGPLLRYRIAG